MQLKSLGEVNASPCVQLRKAGWNKNSREPFQDVNNNQPFTDRGRTTHRTPNRNTSRADDGSPPLEHPSSSTSPPPQCPSRRSSTHHSSPDWHQESLPPFFLPSPTGNSDGRKHSPSRSSSLSDARPRKHLKGHSNNATSTTTEWHGPALAAHAQQQPAAVQPTTLKPLRWLNDQVPTGRPKAHDYEHDICRLIIKSCREFSATVCTQDALPNPETQVEWSRKIWEGACKEVEDHYECTDRVIGLVSWQSLWCSCSLRSLLHRSKLEAAMLELLLRMPFGPRSVPALDSPRLRRLREHLLLATRRYANAC